MSTLKRGSGMDYFYNHALFGVPSGYQNNQAANRERLLEQNIQRNIAELAVNRFKWDGLPEAIDPRFLEMTLLLNGLAVFYWDDRFDKLLCVKASPTGYVNFMDWPTSFTIIGPGSQISDIEGQTTFMPKRLSAFNPFADRSEKDRRKGIPMWPNYFRQSEIDTILIFATRLAKTDHTLEINTGNARQNKVITSTANTKLSMVNIGRQIDEGVNAIQPKDAATMDNISVVDLGIDPDLFDKLSILRTRWWNECMGLLGIDNANQDKKERLVAAEVGANDSQTDSMRYVALNARRQAADYINTVFDLDIKVEYNVEVEQMAREAAVNNGIDPESESE